MFEDDEAANDNAGAPTELKRARSHLLVCQADLAAARHLAWCLAGKRSARFAESAFLAALSWVGDAQDREAAKDGTWYRPRESH